MGVFDAAVARLAAAARGAGEGALDAPTRWGAGETTVWLLLPRMVFHNGTHCGQLADLRRALGLGSVFA